MGIFEISHVTVCSAVERIDDHFAVNGTRDFDAAIFEVGRNRGDLPFAFTNGFGLLKEPRRLTAIDGLLTVRTFAQELKTARIELAMKGCVELDRFGRKDFGLSILDRRKKFHTAGRRLNFHEWCRSTIINRFECPVSATVL